MSVAADSIGCLHGVKIAFRSELRMMGRNKAFYPDRLTVLPVDDMTSTAFKS